MSKPPTLPIFDAFLSLHQFFFLFSVRGGGVSPADDARDTVPNCTAKRFRRLLTYLGPSPQSKLDQGQQKLNALRAANQGGTRRRETGGARYSFLQQRRRAARPIDGTCAKGIHAEAEQRRDKCTGDGERNEKGKNSPQILCFLFFNYERKFMIRGRRHNDVVIRKLLPQGPLKRGVGCVKVHKRTTLHT